MLWKERKKAYNLAIIVAITMAINSILLQFFDNPLTNPNKNTTSIFVFLDYLFKATIIMSIVVVCVCLIVYACHYYNKLHAKEIAMLKTVGCKHTQILLYQLVQTSIIVCISSIIGVLLSLGLIPILLFLFYYIAGIEGTVFFYSIPAYYQSFFIFIILLIIIIFIQAKYTVTSSIPELLKGTTTINYKAKKSNTLLLEYVYLFSYFLGLLSVHMGDLSQGLLLPSCLSAIGAYGIAKLIIPEYITEKLCSNKLEAKRYLIYANYIQNIQQLKTLLLFLMTMLIMLSTMVVVTYLDMGYYILFQLSYMMSMIVLSYSFVNRFKINRVNKDNYYNSLNRLGLTAEEIKAITTKEIALVYVSVFVLAIIFLINLIGQFVINDTIPITIGILVIMEFLIPFSIACLITMLEERAVIRKWEK